MNTIPVKSVQVKPAAAPCADFTSLPHLPVEFCALCLWERAAHPSPAPEIRA